MSKRLARKLTQQLSKQVSDERLVLQFQQCTTYLLENNCRRVQLFELFHEFGHYCKALERGGIVTLIKVSQFTFFIQTDRIICEYNSCDNTSFVLCTFLNSPNLLIDLREVAWAGIAFSSSVLFKSGFCVSSFMFNLVNSKWWFLYRRGSDAYLYYRYFTNHENAVIFNNHAAKTVESLKLKDLSSLKFRRKSK